MQKLKINYIFLVLVLGIFISVSSCKKSDSENSYHNSVSTIMNNYCVGCHSGSTASAGLDLTSYASVKAEAQTGNLYARITDTINPMPPTGPMPQADIDKINAWINEGYPK